MSTSHIFEPLGFGKRRYEYIEQWISPDGGVANFITDYKPIGGLGTIAIFKIKWK